MAAPCARPSCKARSTAGQKTPEERAELHKRLERIRKEEKRLAKKAKEMGFRYTPAELGERLEIDARIEREQLHRAGKGPAADTEYKPIRRMANHASDGMARRI